jgi:Flp pilus assembly protein TadD
VRWTVLADALEHEPIDAEMWSRVGAVPVRKGETMKGAAAFRIALRLDPNHSEAHRQLATVLAAHGSSAEARLTSASSISRTRGRPDALRQSTESLEQERVQERPRSRDAN